MAAWLTKLRLQTRIALLVVAGLVLIFILSAWQGMRTLDTVTQMVLDERLALAGASARHADDHLGRLLDRLDEVVASPTFNLEDGDMEPEKAALRDLYRSRQFSYLFLLDRGKRVLWTAPYLPNAVGRPYPDCPHLLAALRTGQPAIVCATHTLTPQSPVVAPVVPIKNEKGTVVGLLGAAIDPTSPAFTDILQGIPQGDTGYAQIVDENGIVLLHTQGRHLFQRSEHADLFASWLQEHKAGVTTQVVDEEGRGASREVIAFAPLTVTSWGVAVEQAESELLAPALALRRKMMLIAMVALAGAIFLVWITTRSVIEPVRKLVAASERIAAGDLATPVPPLGEDEIGDLGRAFDDMRQRLAHWGEELETKVAERTRDLSIVYGIDRAAARSLELEEVLNHAVEATLQALDIEAGGIYLLEPDGETVALQVHRGLSDEFVEAVQRIRLGEGVSGQAAAERRPIVLQESDYPTERLAPFVAREGFQTLASVPLLSAGELVGALSLGTRRPRAFPAEELELLAAIGQQLGQAVQNARLYQETQQRLARVERMNGLARTLGGTLALSDLFPRLLPPVLQLTSADAGTVAILDPYRQVITYPYHHNLPDTLAGVEVPAGTGLAGLAMESNEPVLLDDYRDHPAALAPWVEAGVRSTLAVPLQVGDEVVGAMGLFSLGEVRPFEQDTVTAAQAAGHLAAVAIQRARLFESERKRAAQLALVADIARRVASILDPDHLLQEAADAIQQTFGYYDVILFLIDQEAGELTMKARAGSFERPFPQKGSVRKIGETGIVDWMARHGETLVANDVRQEPRYRPFLSATRSELCVPIKDGERVVAGINIESERLYAFDEADVVALETLAAELSVALTNARLYKAEQRRAARLTALHELGVELATLSDEADVLRTLVKRAAALAQSPTCTVLLMDEAAGEAVLAAQTGLPEDTPPDLRIPLTLPIIRRSLETGQPIIVPDIDRDAPEMRTILIRHDIRAFFAYPMMRKGRAIGYLTLSSLKPHVPSAEQATAYRLLADRAAAALANARLFAETLRRARHTQALNAVISAAAEQPDLASLLEATLDHTMTALGLEMGAIWLRDTPTASPQVVVRGLPPEIGQVSRQVATRAQLDLTEPTVTADWMETEIPDPLQEMALRFGVRASITVPLLAVGQRIGGLSVAVPAPRAWTPDEIVLIQAIGQQLGGAVERARLFEETHHRLAELSALFAVSGALREAATVEEMLPIILEKTVEVLQADTAVLFSVDERTQDLVGLAAHGRFQRLLGMRLGPTEGVCGYVAQTRAPYSFADLADDPHTGPKMRPLVAGVQGGACVPLVAGEGLLGSLVVGNDTPRGFTDDEIHLLTAIANMAASAIHRAGLFEELQARVQELTTVYQVSQTITASLRIGEVLGFIVGAATRATRAEGCYLFLWDEQQERLVLQAVEGFYEGHVGRMKYRLGEGVAGWVLLEGKPANIPDVGADPRWKRDPEHEATLPSGQANSALVVPLVVGEKTLGVLGVVNKTGASAFTETDQSLLTTLAGQVAIAIENARLYEDVRGLSIATIRSLATAIDARDPYTRGHSEGVTQLAVQIARELGWGGADLEMLEFAALLHDVGKIAIPDAILRKVEPLTQDDRNKIHLHPYYSAQIVKPVEPLKRIVPWIYHHHERWDGDGYPDGLAGEDIPLASRIIAVADTYNAMTTDRPYRTARSHAEAMVELRECAGTQFDPQVVEAFVHSTSENVQD